MKSFNGSKFRGLSSTISVADDFIGLTPLSGAANAPIQYVQFPFFSRYHANSNVFAAFILFMALEGTLLDHGRRT